MSLVYRAYALTDPGRRREINEDSVGQRSLAGGGLLAVVADGVGGSPGGALASRLTVETLLGGAAPGAGEDAADWLRRAGARANAAVRRARGRHPGYEEMASTVVALFARGAEATLLHAGDSRCYRWRGGMLEALTRDHTVAEQMLVDGTLRPAEVATTPYQHLLTRAVGSYADFPHSLQQAAIQAGDLLLLCSDGLNKVLDSAAIAAALATAASPETAAASLVAAANAAGGPDNVSVILITCSEAGR